MKFIRVISKKKKQLQNPWLDFDGQGPYIVVIYVINRFSNNPEINKSKETFANKIQAISYASKTFKKLQKKYDVSFRISVEVLDNNHILVKKFEQ